MKNQIVWLTVLLVIGAMQVASADTTACNGNNKVLHYTIDKPQQAFKSNMILVRHDAYVLHRYPEMWLTQGWEKNAKGGVKTTRYFDQDKRAIEYQPADLQGKLSEEEWQQAAQLFSPAQLKQFNKVSQQGEGCEQVDFLERKEGSLTHFLQYMPAQGIVKNFRIVDTVDVRLQSDFQVYSKELKTTEQVMQQWTLHDLNPENTKKHASAQHLVDEVLAYKSTDYADIGDDHSDPFLIKMLNLGFIAPSASGFYNTEGAPMAGQNNHYH